LKGNQFLAESTLEAMRTQGFFEENNMEKWKFQIKFSGLTAFVIRPDRSGARAILINALEINQQRHRPEFRFDAQDVTESPWKIPLPQITNVSQNRRIWHLSYLDLNYLPAPDVTLTQNFELDTATINQIVSLATISPDASKINPECLGPHPPNNLVLIRVPLRHGKLSSTKLITDVQGKVNCGFGQMTPPHTKISHEQHCAIEVTLELTVDRGPLTLIGVPFSGEMSSGIAFRPRKDKSEVVVDLENRPIGHEKYQPTGARAERADEDFSLYYDLTQPPLPPMEKRIVPIYVYDNPYTMERVNCIIGKYKDDPGA
jgi:hypothetical protein